VYVYKICNIYLHKVSDILSWKFDEEIIWLLLAGRIQQNNNLMTELILRQVVHQMERGFIEFARNSFEQQHRVQNSFVSSGCLICIIWKGRLFVANVGDSRAIVCSMQKNGIFNILGPEQIVRDHNFLNPDIQEELTELQSDHNSSRYQCIEVKGLIETSRCIGYAYLKNSEFTKSRSFEIPLSEVVTPTLTRPLLSSQPDVTSRALRDTDRFIILGSSGFWKLMSNEEAVEVVRISPKDGIAERLAKLALEKGASKRGKNHAELLEIPASNCVSGNNGNQNLAFRPAYHDDITVIVVSLDLRANREGVKPKINSYRGYDDTVRPSKFRNFYNNANK
jgi:pyruvate dehydrogenase phosphatase